ncbi:Serine/threonine transporter SstT [Bienertia sinuspersici]
MNPILRFLKIFLMSPLFARKQRNSRTNLRTLVKLCPRELWFYVFVRD